MKVLPFARPLTIRAVLVVGFGLTLGLWLFSGYSFSRRISDLQRASARVTARYVRAQNRLSAVRSQVLLASVYARDALLDPDPESIVEYRMKLEEAFRIAGRSLDEYEPVIGTPTETARIQQLAARIEEFRASIFDVLNGDSTRWRTEALPLLRNRIMPKREETIQVSEEVQSLNRGSYVDQQSATASIYGGAQERIWTQFGLAVAASFFIGLSVVRRVATLEAELRQRQEQDAATTAELQRLSAQIVTAQEDERRSIARELHDEVGQALTAIKVELAVAERRAQAPGTLPVLDSVRSLTEGALQTIRDLSRLLHPAVLDDIGLVAALESYVRDFRRRYDMMVEFTQEGESTRLPADGELCAYRIVQEALTNIARHAGATRCRVIVRTGHDSVGVIVEDNGIGFEPAMDRGTGLGLIGMRERVARLAGACTIDSAPGAGTRVTVTLPLRGAASRAAFEPPAGTVLGLSHA
jgi:signal transduction histidine kinase